MKNTLDPTPNPTRQRWITKLIHRLNRAHDHGQSLVEISLMLPVLFLLLLGAAQFGYLFYAHIEVTNAARAGVQYGAQNHATASDNPGMTLAALQDGTNISTLSVTPSHSCACSGGTGTSTCTVGDCPGYRILEYVQVNTSAVVTPPVHLLGTPTTYTLNGLAIMRVEQ